MTQLCALRGSDCMILISLLDTVGSGQHSRIGSKIEMKKRNWLVGNEEWSREEGVKWKGLNGIAHAGNGKVGKMVIISKVEACWKGFNNWNRGRSDFGWSGMMSHL